MPLQRIDLATGRSAEQRRAIADAVHRALVDAIGVPADDRFQIVTEHPRDAIVCAPEYLGVRHEDPVFLQLTIATGRTVEQKKSLYRRLAELLEQAGVPRNDVIVSLVEVGRVDWSFGDGAMQYAPPPTPPASE
jgi:phenylpyruvate tautomerase PptA (4-oxalocrotonate tautomerase family)